jgi:hypothetical protein
MKCRLVKTALLLAIMGMFLSCVGIDANIRIMADGRVEMDLSYDISIFLDQIGKLGANERYLPLPVGQDDLVLAVRRAGGELLSWKRSDSADRMRIESRLSFPDTAALAAFMDPSGSKATADRADGRNRLVFQLSSGNPPADSELEDFVKLVFTDYRINMAFNMPRTPRTSSNMTVEGQRARFSMDSASLYTAQTPVLIELSW